MAEEPVTLKSYPNTSIIREYRIIIPLTVEEYHIGQLYGVAEASKNETGGGDGIEIVANEPKDALLDDQIIKSQHTHKIFHLASKVPKIVKQLVSKGALEMHEIAYNAYPYCKTTYLNPDYMKDDFHIDIETKHVAGRGDIENVHNLSQKELLQRKVVVIDIADNTTCDRRDYKESEDPSKFKSVKTNRGPLVGKGWEKNIEPVMCCYKLYRVKFKWWGIQTRVESMILKSVQRLLYNFHRQVFCWIDKWHGMTIEDIRELEERTKNELEELRRKGSVRGTKE